MKKSFSLLLILSLLASVSISHAQTVREQIVAPEHLTDVFTSNTGKTVINVNADVDIPQVETVPRFPAACAVFSVEDARRLSQAVLPGAAWKVQEEGTRIQHDAPGFASVHDLYLTCDEPELNVWRTVSADHTAFRDESYGAGLSYRVQHDIHRQGKGGINYNAGSWSYPITGNGIEGHALSTTQAVAKTNQLVAQITDQSFHLTSVGWRRGVLYDDEQGNPQAGITYGMTYRRVVAGIPLLTISEAMLPVDGQSELFTVPIGYESMDVVLDEQGEVAGFSWLNPLLLGAQEAADWELLPFDAVIASAKALMPLTLAYLEKDGDSAVTIDRIALEYMPVLCRDQPSSYVLTPVWNFYGTGELPWFHCTMQNYSFLTLNAVDGTVIDRQYGY